MDWSNDDIERLKALLAEGCSNSVIARAIGKGLTRNAVAGIIHRHGLSGDRPVGTGAAAKPRAARTRDKIVSLVPKAKPMPRSAAPVDAPAPVLDAEGRPTTLRTARDRQCRWYIAEESGVDGQICANPTDSGKSFCAHHQARLRNAAAMQQLRRSLDAVPTVKARALKHA